MEFAFFCGVNSCRYFLCDLERLSSSRPLLNRISLPDRDSTTVQRGSASLCRLKTLIEPTTSTGFLPLSGILVLRASSTLVPESRARRQKLLNARFSMAILRFQSGVSLSNGIGRYAATDREGER